VLVGGGWAVDGKAVTGASLVLGDLLGLFQRGGNLITGRVGKFTLGKFLCSLTGNENIM